jgi:hypothetical protein
VREGLDAGCTEGWGTAWDVGGGDLLAARLPVSVTLCASVSRSLLVGFVSCRVAVPRDHPVHRKTVLAVGEMGCDLVFWFLGGLDPGVRVCGGEVGLSWGFSGVGVRGGSGRCPVGVMIRLRMLAVGCHAHQNVAVRDEC